MAREKTNPHDPYWANWHARATHSTETLHVYTWTCAHCRTVNVTRINTRDPRTPRRCLRGVEARCGRCHGNVLRLTDRAGLTYDPCA